MILAKNKNGEIGRKVPGQGFNAKVALPTAGERRGNLYLSSAQIEDDEAYWKEVENRTRALHQAEAIANKVKAEANRLRAKQKAQEVRAFQRLAKLDPMNETLKGYFARKGMMGETEMTVQSLQTLPAAPADFSSSGGNLDYVHGERMTGGEEWRSDFRQHLIVGNPLTRDGVYGPAVTDYDRYVQGDDINQWDQVEIAGGTMLGRYDGKTAPAGMGRQALIKMAPARRLPPPPPPRNRVRGGNLRGMGSWWDSFTDTVSSVASQTYDNVVDDLPDQLAKEVQQAILGGGSATTNAGTGVVNVTRPVAGSTTTVVQSQPLPQWAKYAMIGGGVLVGGLVLVSLVKAVKS